MRAFHASLSPLKCKQVLSLLDSFPKKGCDYENRGDGSHGQINKSRIDGGFQSTKWKK
jgi:hypothetical protein